MVAWSKMTPEQRDRVFLYAAFLTEPDSIRVNLRSKNDREWVASLIERKLLSRHFCITRSGKKYLRDLNDPRYSGN